MKYPHGTQRVGGVLIPVAALRSTHSAGCGEFADLKALADWCASTGQKIIQILPVNDTGSQSSPYSALSAYALHPIYTRISDLPEYTALSAGDRAAVDDRIAEIRERYERSARFDYDGVPQRQAHHPGPGLPHQARRDRQRSGAGGVSRGKRVGENLRRVPHLERSIPTASLDAMAGVQRHRYGHLR